MTRFLRPAIFYPMIFTALQTLSPMSNLSAKILKNTHSINEKRTESVTHSSKHHTQHTLKIRKDCDMPGASIKSLKTSSPEKCGRICNKNSACQAFTYISGWGRCFLKSKATRTVNLIISAGKITTTTGERIIKPYGQRVDIPGKDLRKVSEVQTSSACAEACLHEKKCVAYSYLDVYRDCWLKNRSGQTQTKVFYCGEVLIN